jgi:hypothetical protein
MAAILRVRVLSRHCEERSDEAIHTSLRPDGLLRFARNDGLLQDCVLDCATPSSTREDVHSPEMAHFFAQNIIARCDLFSEN